MMQRLVLFIAVGLLLAGCNQNEKRQGVTGPSNWNEPQSKSRALSSLVPALMNRGAVEMQLGQHADAEATMTKAIALLKNAPPDRMQQIGRAMTLLGDVYAAQGRQKEAAFAYAA